MPLTMRLPLDAIFRVKGISRGGGCALDDKLVRDIPREAQWFRCESSRAWLYIKPASSSIAVSRAQFCCLDIYAKDVGICHDVIPSAY
jgi:hypothetical protein